MRAKTDTSAALVQALVRRSVPFAAPFAQAWRRLFGGSYRPEKHYMRGPGPKWREKYAPAGAKRPAKALRAE